MAELVDALALGASGRKTLEVRLLSRPPKIMKINKKNILSGKLKGLIPEFYDLKNTVEDNEWHIKETVFDHSLSVLENLEKIFRNLDKNILNKSRKNLLRIAALLHDISKPETMVYENGIANSLGHEQKGSIKAKKILKRFNLSKKESGIITNVVKYHGLIHKIISPDNKNFQEEYKKFKKRFSKSIFFELILLGYADTIGSYLKKSNPNRYKHRINFYKKELKKL